MGFFPVEAGMFSRCLRENHDYLQPCTDGVEVSMT